MKKIFWGVPALLLLCASSAYAHGPVRQDTDLTITINAPAEKVWDIIKNFGDMSWLPAVANTSATGGNEKGAVRELTLKNGGTIKEEIKKYDEKKMSYAYKITEMSTAQTINHAGKDEAVPVLPVDNYSAAIQVEAQGASSVVKWKAAYYRAYTNNDPPAEMNESAANNAVKTVLQEGLDNLKALAEK